MENKTENILHPLTIVIESNAHLINVVDRLYEDIYGGDSMEITKSRQLLDDAVKAVRAACSGGEMSESSVIANARINLAKKIVDLMEEDSPGNEDLHYEALVLALQASTSVDHCRDLIARR